MPATSKLAERFGPRVRIASTPKVPAGSPVRLRLGYRQGANTVKAAVILARRHMPLRTAHAALTDMLESGGVDVAVPCVEDLEILTRELEAIGLTVEALS